TQSGHGKFRRGMRALQLALALLRIEDLRQGRAEHRVDSTQHPESTPKVPWEPVQPWRGHWHDSRQIVGADKYKTSGRARTSKSAELFLRGVTVVQSMSIRSPHVADLTELLLPCTSCVRSIGGSLMRCFPMRGATSLQQGR